MKISERYDIGLLAIVALSLLQAGLRIVLGLMMTGALGEGAQDTLNQAIEGQVDDWVFGFNTFMFLALGVLGAVFAVGLVGRSSWAWYGTIIVSGVTIIYDLWATIAIQPSAVLGMVLPALFIAFLVLRRDGFGLAEVDSHARTGGIRN